MRTALPTLVLLTACGGSADGGADTDADTDAVVTTDVAQCTATYQVPGPLGTISDDVVDPHDDVFGSVETLGEGAEVGPDPLHVHLGWPGQDTSRSISFVWTTDTGTLASVVELAEGTDLSGDVTRHEGVSFGFGTADEYRVHELKLCGALEPGTTYSYRVGGEGHWSDVFTFTTPGAPGSFDSFVMVVAGDSRGAYETWATLVDKAMSEDPDLFVFTGDMVTLGGNQLEWHDWWASTADAFAQTVFVPTHGNHEALATNYFAQFSLPGNEQWFSLDYGNATIVSLNDGPSTFDDVAGAQADFLEARLSESTAAWKLAMHHKTMVTSNNHAPNGQAYEAWGPALDDHGADLVLAGHNHVYERSKPIRGGEPVEAGEGPVYLVAGGAGADLYESRSSVEADLARSEVHEPVEHYVVITFDATGAHAVAKRLDGTPIDTFELPLTP